FGKEELDPNNRPDSNLEFWILPIAYESRKLRAAEKNYSPYDGELLALMHCLRTFRPYLVGRAVKVQTDQRALKWLLDQKTLSKRQHRWLDELQEYDLTINWIPGSENTIADALSRRRHDQEIGIQVNTIDEFSPSDTLLDVLRSISDKDAL